ncbi:hypothetical protein C2S53_012896 [Perilla frutescens var. hirtella]|uniref:BAH domain-containing protein n=1 Tax=Perilla frutescens var. hirtella TaxID=608512 RepID=A0AAD4NY52_PERFH|nr:hypothetical protein C2S53_012896 [Perilla frutescens var. hirtella]
MSQPKEQREKPLPFRWGVRKGTINLYESFTLEGIEYSLYDTVYLYRSGQAEPDIGKLVSLMEMENHEKKAEILWFFRPAEIVNCLGGVKPLRKELFLACGEGKGLMKLNPLDAILGKCNVVCSSKDKRNPQPTEEELRMADYIFYRSFDVGTRIISEEFPSSIAGVEVAHFFNRRSCTISSIGSEPKAHLKARSEVEPVRATKTDLSARVEKGFNVPGTSSSGQKYSFIKDRPQAGDNMKRSEHFLSVSPSDIGPVKKRKLLPSSLGNRRDDALPNPPTKASEKEKHVKDPFRENKDLSTGKSLHVKTSEFTGKGPVSKQHVGPNISYKYSEVTRRPVMDSRKWLKLEVWAEERLNEANEKGKIVVLENLDPSFTSSEVEHLYNPAQQNFIDYSFVYQDIVWNVFRENVKAKMVPRTAFSSPHSGQALVIFKTKEAADNACSKLTTGCLVLGDERPIVARRRLPGKAVDSKFVGHLSIDRTRSHRQREEIVIPAT